EEGEEGIEHPAVQARKSGEKVEKEEEEMNHLRDEINKIGEEQEMRMNPEELREFCKRIIAVDIPLKEEDIAYLETLGWSLYGECEGEEKEIWIWGKVTPREEQKSPSLFLNDEEVEYPDSDRISYTKPQIDF
ncbi:MAG: hypothetical protein ABH837_00670, partial [bacterium]